MPNSSPNLGEVPIRAVEGECDGGVCHQTFQTIQLLIKWCGFTNTLPAVQTTAGSI